MPAPDPPPTPPSRVPLAYLVAGLVIWAAILVSLFAPAPPAVAGLRYAAAGCP